MIPPMRLPYLQVTQETWSKARMLSGLAGVDVGVAFMAICDLWRWGLELGPPDEAPTGICDSARADLLMTAAIGWDVSRAAEWVPMLADIGLVERLDVGVRVRGLDRYVEAWEKNRALRTRWQRANEKRRRGDSAVADELPRGNREATDSKPLPKTQTQTQKNRSQDRKAEADTSVGGGGEPEHSAAAFWDWFQKRREAAGLVREKPPHPNTLAGFYSEAMLEMNGERKRLQECALRFGDDKFWQAKDPPLPFSGLMSQWRKYAPIRAA